MPVFFQQSHFNSQPHEEADNILRVLTNLFHISTHSLTRRLTERCFLVKQVNNHFNSQPHEEADWCDCRKHHYRNISTHSLTRRLTTYDSNVIASMPISTHSLTRRLTSRLTYPVEVNGISTHSLTRRLTAWARLKLKEMIFQLTASRGG